MIYNNLMLIKKEFCFGCVCGYGEDTKARTTLKK